MIGGTPIHNTFWQIPEKKHREVSKAIDLQNAVIFGKARKLTKWCVDKANRPHEIGSLLLISRESLKESPKSRKAISRALKRSPAVRICPRVYAFPQIKHSRYQKFKDKIVLPDDVIDLIEKEGARVHVFSNLIPSNPYAADFFVTQVRSRLVDESNEIISACKKLIGNLKCGDVKNLDGIRRQLSELKGRQKSIRNLADFFYYSMRLDARKDVLKAYKALSSCRCAYRNRLVEFDYVQREI